MSTLALLRDQSAPSRGELVWRFGLFAGSINLALFAIGLAETNSRRPNNWNLVFALLGVVVYFNLMTLSQSWVATGRADAATAFTGLHLPMFALALLLLWWREHAAAAAPWRRRQSRRAAA